MTHQPAAADRADRDRGEVTTTVLSMALILVALMLVVQVALAYHARRVVSGSVQDGAATGAMLGSSPAEGAAVAQGLIDASAGHLLVSSSTSGIQDGDTVTVTSTGTVVRVFPLFPTFTVSAQSSAVIERFRPQGEP